MGSWWAVMISYDDFIVCPQSSILEVLTLVVFELPCGWVEKIREDLGVLSVVFHPVVENGVCRSNKASNDVGDLEDMSVGSRCLPRFLFSTGCGEWKGRILGVCAAT